MRHTAMTKEQTVKGEDSSKDVTYCYDDVLYVMTKETTPKDSHRDETHCDDEGKGKEGKGREGKGADCQRGGLLYRRGVLW